MVVRSGRNTHNVYRARRESEFLIFQVNPLVWVPSQRLLRDYTAIDLLVLPDLFFQVSNDLVYIFTFRVWLVLGFFFEK